MQPISIRFEKSLLERLRRLARAESLRRDCDVTMADLIREAVLNAYASGEGGSSEDGGDSRRDKDDSGRRAGTSATTAPVSRNSDECS